jgi:hypothetical protein
MAQQILELNGLVSRQETAIAQMEKPQKERPTMTEQINEPQENKEEVTVNHLSEAKQAFRQGFGSIGLFFTEKTDKTVKTGQEKMKGLTEKADKTVKTGQEKLKGLTEKVSEIVEKVQKKIPGQAKDKEEKAVEEQNKEDNVQNKDNDAQNKPGDQ